MCIPGLHLSLGIFNRLWTLLEEAYNKLDLQLAADCDGSGTGGATFSLYSVLLGERSRVTSQLEAQLSQATMLEQLAIFMNLNLPNQSALLVAVWAEASVAQRTQKYLFT